MLAHRNNTIGALLGIFLSGLSLLSIVMCVFRNHSFRALLAVGPSSTVLVLESNALVARDHLRSVALCHIPIDLEADSRLFAKFAPSDASTILIGKRQFLSSNDWLLQIWDIGHCKNILAISDLSLILSDAAFLDQDRRRVALVGLPAQHDFGTHGIIKTVSLPEGDEILSCEIVGGTPLSICSCHQRREFVLGRTDGVVDVFSSDTLQHLWSPQPESPTHQVNCVAYSDDGKYIVSAGHRLIHVWDAVERRELRRVELPGIVFGVSISRGDATMVSLNSDRGIYVLEIPRDGTLVRLGDSSGRVSGWGHDRMLITMSGQVLTHINVRIGR